MDLKSMFDKGYFPSVKADVFETEFLNDFINLGKNQTNYVRAVLQEELTNHASNLKNDFDDFFFNIKDVTIHLPIDIGDYTDFYSSKNHAENVGRLFRSAENALMENWLHMPIAYHGRSSSIVASGTKIIIPRGQVKKDDEIIFSPSTKVDFELEFATIIGKSNPLGKPIDINDTEDYVFGFCLLNDWSARDIQNWEYKPLGPFLGKNFATTISPWIVTIEALEPFKTKAVKQTKVLPYLQADFPTTFNINLSVELNGQKLTDTNFSKLYWTINQQISHHTVNGCNLRVGDVLGSGTISDEKEKGSLLELTFNGEKPIIVNNEKRTFLRNGDCVKLSGYAIKHDKRVGFGNATGTLINENEEY
jgi:fumarylacetoacetase